MVGWYQIISSLCFLFWPQCKISPSMFLMCFSHSCFHLLYDASWAQALDPWEIPHSWWSSVVRVNEGRWKSWAKGVEMFACDTSQEICALGGVGLTVFQLALYNGSLNLLCYVNRKGRMWNAQPCSLSLSNKQIYCRIDVNQGSTCLWDVLSC